MKFQETSWNIYEVTKRSNEVSQLYSSFVEYKGHVKNRVQKIRETKQQSTFRKDVIECVIFKAKMLFGDKVHLISNYRFVWLANNLRNWTVILLVQIV